MRVALAGLGGAAIHGHIPALRGCEAERRLRLVAVADRSAAAREWAESALPGVPLFASADSMLSSVQAELLVIATEPSSHTELVELGISRGLQVICEKPLVSNAAELRALRDVMRSSRELGLITVHQYRYARPLIRLLPWFRAARVAGAPTQTQAEVCRRGLEDPHARSSWRGDLSKSGGALADHGAHFLALAWSIDPRLSVISGSRVWEAGGRERSSARIEVGSGTLDLRVSTASNERRTRLRVRTPGLSLDWDGASACCRLGGLRLASRQVGSLSDREYLDSLYVPFYRGLLQGLPSPSWRAERTSESLAVGAALVDLLGETASASLTR